MTEWFLIIIVTTLGGLFGSDTVTKQKLGPYATEESCLQAAQSVPQELRWKSGGKFVYMTGKTADIGVFCVPVPRSKEEE